MIKYLTIPLSMAFIFCMALPLQAQQLGQSNGVQKQFKQALEQTQTQTQTEGEDVISCEFENRENAQTGLSDVYMICRGVTNFSYIYEGVDLRTQANSLSFDVLIRIMSVHRAVHGTVKEAKLIIGPMAIPGDDSEGVDSPPADLCLMSQHSAYMDGGGDDACPFGLPEITIPKIEPEEETETEWTIPEFKWPSEEEVDPEQPLRFIYPPFVVPDPSNPSDPPECDPVPSVPCPVEWPAPEDLLDPDWDGFDWDRLYPTHPEPDNWIEKILDNITWRNGDFTIWNPLSPNEFHLNPDTLLKCDVYYDSFGNRVTVCATIQWNW